jgi:hypothetical protein
MVAHSFCILAAQVAIAAQPPAGLQQAVNSAVDAAATQFKTAFSLAIVGKDWEISTQASVV